MDWKLVCLKMMGQCNFSIAPAIYHFLICSISFANPKNFSLVILHLYSRNPQSSKMMAFVAKYTNKSLPLICGFYQNMQYWKYNWSTIYEVVQANIFKIKLSGWLSAFGVSEHFKYSLKQNGKLCVLLLTKFKWGIKSTYLNSSLFVIALVPNTKADAWIGLVAFKHRKLLLINPNFAFSRFTALSAALIVVPFINM